MVRGEDLITDPDLTKIGGPVDVEGGWADAGDYLKFTHSSAYNDVVLFTSARLLGARAPAALVDEARYGAGLAGQDVGRAVPDPAPAGRGRLGQQAGHLHRRPRRVAAPRGRRPRHRPAAPVRRAPAGPRRRAGRPADQPEPRRPGLAAFALAVPAGARPGQGAAQLLGKAQLALRPRRHRRSPEAAGHRAPPRVLPGVGLAGRHGARRRRDRPRGAAAGPPRGVVPRRRSALGEAVPQAPLRRHPQPVRRGRARPREPGRRHGRGAARHASR